jgi:adenine-specific DNA methylase
MGKPERLLQETDNMTDTPRLIEHAFPLKQASLDSVHEKNVRHGHISTLHIWPARRPLAACRAALIATLLPDPGTAAARKVLCEKIGGRVVRKMEKKKMPGGAAAEREKEQTEGGILHWLGEEPTSGGKKKRDQWRLRKKRNEQDLMWFREEIRKAYGGRAPKVLDPFAGGGAIPLEAMRLGCEATAIDINPVAWFILKCTLEYPQKLASQKRQLPAFILKDREFMEAFFKAQGLGKGDIRKELAKIGHTNLGPATEAPSMFAEDARLDADLAWHVRAWGQWVLAHARKELARFYPVYADFEPLDPGMKSYERREMRLVPLKADGTPDMAALNGDFSDDYLAVKGNPRWVAKPTVAYLWARTVTCKNCRATIPLLKTRWLCKKDKKRVLLTMDPNRDKTGVVFGVETDVPIKGSNAAQRREHDKRLGTGTMSRAGAKCPRCPAIMTMEDIRVRGQAKELGEVMTAVVVDGNDGKEYRLPTEQERTTAADSANHIDPVFADVPFGVPDEPIAGADALGMRVPLYGLTKWRDLFTPRQLLALGAFVQDSRAARTAMARAGYPAEWAEGLSAALAIVFDKTADYSSTICSWIMTLEAIRGTFTRFALPMVWDFTETNPFASTAGSYSAALNWVCQATDHLTDAADGQPAPHIVKQSAKVTAPGTVDLIVTDPPYYDAIPYSDLMDFFYIWLRRTLYEIAETIDGVFREPLGPKWDAERNDGELIDDESRHAGDWKKSKQTYEDGMFHAFEAMHKALAPTGRMVIVFAHKDPDAWETLAAAAIRAGFVVDGSWPIQTERTARVRSLTSAALASSVWLVCKKRSTTARPGWDNKVLDEMRANISLRLREFWDAGIRGPDFVWAATGPALEAYSKHPVVKMADEAGKVMTVSDFLAHARRMVVDFVVGRVLSGETADVTPAMDRLDEPTAYYLLHRHDFGLDEAPAGACILYATACGLSDDALIRDWDLLVKTGGDDAADDGEDEEEAEESDEPAEETGSGSKVKLKAWNHRRGRSLGLEAPGGRPVPIIDRIHRLMQLWKAGDVHKVDEYLDEHGLRRHELFRRVLQSIIELARPGGDERSLLESLSNHVGAKGAKKKDAPSLAFGDDDSE